MTPGQAEETIDLLKRIRTLMLLLFFVFGVQIGFLWLIYLSI